MRRFLKALFKGAEAPDDYAISGFATGPDIEVPVAVLAAAKSSEQSFHAAMQRLSR